MAITKPITIAPTARQSLAEALRLLCRAESRLKRAPKLAEARDCFEACAVELRQAFGELRR